MIKYTLDDFKKRNLQDQKSLTDALAWASEQYYVYNNPPIGDFEFDMELRALENLERANNFIYPNSPTLRVGSDIQEGFKKSPHIIPMQSIENVYSQEELIAWVNDIYAKLCSAFPKEEISFAYEPKYDGVSISLVYKNGELVDAVTRGDQLVGDSVVENVKTISSVPLRLDTSFGMPEYFEVRGEVLMPEGAFLRLNSVLKTPFSNKRNAASGSLKQLDPKETRTRGLVVNVYAAYVLEDSDFSKKYMSSQEKTLKLLEKLGFLHLDIGEPLKNPQELADAVDKFDELRVSGKLDFDCDGVVVKVNLRKHQEYLGIGTKSPNWCRARKFPQVAKSTKLLDVIFQVGVRGRITPVAVLEPVEVGGVVISRATLSNESCIKSLGIKIGDYVFVQRAAEVIPQITGVDPTNPVENSQDIHFPVTCPSCGQELEKEGEFYLCTNHSCHAQIVSRLSYWCRKEVANIVGVGGSIIEDIVEKLAIKSVDSMYRYFFDDTEERQNETMLKLGEGYGKRSVKAIFDGVNNSRITLTLERIINGFCIDGVGGVTAKDLANHFKSLEALTKAQATELTEVENIGDVIAQNILNFFCAGLPDDYACLNDERFGFATKVKAQEILSSSLAGLSIIFTGTSYRFKRDEIKEFFTKHGAKYVSSVSKKTSFVVIGDAPGQNKIDAANKNGIEIIAERDFYERYGL